MADKYILRVTAGPGYELDNHQEVPVNHHQPILITSDQADVELSVRVQDYKGLPFNSPTSSPYFEQEPHKYNQDQYSISFKFTPKKAVKGDNAAAGGDDNEEGISGLDLQFGNDFDRPIRERLPPGFNTAMGIVKWWIDPGLDGDAYADRPYLYGPALSSFNAIHIGDSPFDESKGGIWVEEGGDEEVREKYGMPADNKGRMKWALNDQVKQDWVWKYDQTYSVDFYNPYLDFSNFALRLPGFHLPIMKYWDGQGLRTTPRRSHTLRYVLRNRKTGACLLAVCFTIHRREDVAEDGTVQEDNAAEEAKVKAPEAEGDAAAVKTGPQTTDDDID